MILWLAIAVAVAVYVWALRRARRLAHERTLSVESDYERLVRESLVEYEAIHADG